MQLMPCQHMWTGYAGIVVALTGLTGVDRLVGVDTSMKLCTPPARVTRVTLSTPNGEENSYFIYVTQIRVVLTVPL